MLNLIEVPPSGGATFIRMDQQAGLLSANSTTTPPVGHRLGTRAGSPLISDDRAGEHLRNTETPWILGLSAAHNGSACLLHGTEIVAAVQEERLSGVKRDRTYGAAVSLATEYCLRHAGIEPGQLDSIVLCVQGEASHAEQDVSLNHQLRQCFNGVPALRISHHLGHAISAYAVSGFSDAAILVVDGMGSPDQDLSEEERRAVIGAPGGWEIISMYEASGTTVRPIAKQLVPAGKWLDRAGAGMPGFGSIGGMYSAVAQQIFGDPMDAGKVMGLAPFGTPSFRPHEFVSVTNGLATFATVVPERFRHSDRWPLRQREYADLAASVQAALEEAILALVSRLRASSTSAYLCYSGGVALNCPVNERLMHESGFSDVFVAPFAEDSGPAVGAAFYGLWRHRRHRPARLVTEGFGHRYGPSEVHEAIRSIPLVAACPDMDATDIADVAADRLERGQLGAWFDGRSEFGPRALGQRSIVADPRRAEHKTRLNRDVKQREAFRPFAPSVLAEHVHTWFDVDEARCDSPFMLRAFTFRPGYGSRVPAVAHVDDSARVQSVREELQPRFHALIQRFHDRTGVPMILNTSLNGSGQPIVETPSDALWTMLELGLDFAVIEGVLVEPAADFDSVLGLVPVIAAESYTVDHSFPSGPTISVKSRVSAVDFKVVTPWGSRLQPLTAEALSVLAVIDGVATGHEIHERLRRDQNDELTAAQLTRTMRFLRRTRIVDFWTRLPSIPLVGRQEVAAS
ncbi:carbamoyltransferase family protein [Streptomyces litmocidini]|uniref:carbamoyltransferase family protein n=1 Tax=Streptomyces litmocidini TaxID=67318 RepID=UPI00167EEFE7|nr:carbamoyltransferase C-terminal domain-containing protein [Streptomyces litmocidini]